MDGPPWLDRLRAALADVEDLVFAYLFGSQARGDARPDSDIDVAAYPATADRKAFYFQVLGRLADDLPASRVHLVNLRDAPPGLVFRIARDGLLLVDRAPAQRVGFIARHLSRYQDMEHARRLVAAADARRARG